MLGRALIQENGNLRKLRKYRCEPGTVINTRRRCVDSCLYSIPDPYDNLAPLYVPLENGPLGIIVLRKISQFYHNPTRTGRLPDGAPYVPFRS
jgi:hypothetical protein